MHKESIALSHTGQFPRFVCDYLSQENQTDSYTDYRPDMSGLVARKKELSAKGVQTLLVAEAIREQYDDIALSESQQRHLDLLSSSQAFTITTGHQVALFGGPLFLLHKIASTIRLAAMASETLNVPVVPIFWMATEDHDIAEVDHIDLFDQRLRLEHTYTGMAGRMPLESIDQVLDSVKEQLGDRPCADRLTDLLSSCYGSSDTLSSALRKFVQRLFGTYGILCLDADEQRLKGEFAGIVADELQKGFSHQAMQDTLEAIRNRGEQPQAEGRALNLFYIEGSQRFRLEKTEDGFRAVGKELEWSTSEMMDIGKEFPERFSPNVILRPLYQESILPNLAYIGGPGEISYWLQLKQVFHHSGMQMPVLLLRDSVSWWNKGQFERWTAVGLTMKDLFQDEHRLMADLARRESDSDLNLMEEQKATLEGFDRLIARTEHIDPSTAQFAKAERQRLHKTLDNIEKKLIRAEKKKHDTALKRIERIRQQLLPGGQLQERMSCCIPLLCYDEDFIEKLMHVSNPLQAEVKMVVTD